MDLLDDSARAELAISADANTAIVSALTGDGVEELLHRIDGALVNDPIRTAALRIPQSEGAVLAALEAGGVIESSRFEGNLTHLVVRAPASLIGRFRRFLDE